MSLPTNPDLLMAGGTSPYYNVQRSLRFRSSASAYLSRTNVGTPTNNKIFTVSKWVKRGTINDATSFENLLGGTATQSDTFGFGSVTNNAGDSIQIRDASVGSYNLLTTQVFRDPSAWYHLVLSIDTTQATAANRVKLYVNGVQVTSFSTATYPAQNYVFEWNAASTATVIARRNSTSATYFFDGYLSEVNFIDGQALTPSSFGYTDPTTGVWMPKKYNGTYGNNGFYLPFTNTTNTTNLCLDASGNSNNWTPNNISLTAGVTYDSMLDVPTNWGDGGNGRGNYCVLNPLDKNTITVSDANLSASYGSAAWYMVRGTMTISTGKWYWEITATSASSHCVGIATASASLSGVLGGDASGWGYWQAGYKYNSGSPIAYGATWTTNDVIGIAFDADAGTLTFYKNNTSQGTAYSGLSANVYFPAVSENAGSSVINFGQRPFAYTPPSGFKALNTLNLPAPTILNGARYMAAVTYSGTSASNTVVATASNSGNNPYAVAFQPDLVWIKSRSAATDNKLTDSVRGVTKALISNTTGAETTDANGLTAFTSSGFTVGSDSVYNNGTGPATYVAWEWQAGKGVTSSNTSGSITSTVSVNQTAGFSVVTYTGTGANATVGHGLGVKPSMIICKSRSTSDWAVYHTSTTAAGVLWLNLTNQYGVYAPTWNSTEPTSSVFSVGTAASTNGSSTAQVSFCWAPIRGFSSFGSYTGNGSTDGPFVYLGFRPRYILQKRTDTTGTWEIYDTSRDTYNIMSADLSAESAAAEVSTARFDFLSNGFKIRTTGAATNASGGTYIYAAFAENPFNVSRAR